MDSSGLDFLPQLVKGDEGHIDWEAIGQLRPDHILDLVRQVVEDLIHIDLCL